MGKAISTLLKIETRSWEEEDRGGRRTDTDDCYYDVLRRSTMTTRVMIEAAYKVVSTFYLPTGITQLDIAEHYIKYDQLHVTLKDGVKMTIEPFYSAAEGNGCDFKYPDEEYMTDEEIDPDTDDEEETNVLDDEDDDDDSTKD